jgi:DNA-binding transcriptional LysR family regulator
MVPIEFTYFLETSSTLNLSRASERLGISQPTLSIAIKRLETSIGTHLFLRHKNGVSLTQAGKQLLAHIKQLIQNWDEIKAKTLASHHEVQGNISIGCHVSVGLHYLAGFLPKVFQDHPKLEVQLKHDISRKITESVINLSIDIGIVINPYKHPDLIIVKLANDVMTLWQKKELQNNSDRQNQDIVLCNPELSQTQSLLSQCKKQGMHFQRIITSNNLEIIAKLTAAGGGIAILPSCVTKEILSSVLVPVLNAPVYTDELCVIFRHENRNVKAVQVIVEHIKTMFPSA